MKRFLAAVVCITLLGMPVLGQDCCADKQQAQKQTQQCSAKKQCSKDKMAKGSCCDDKKMAAGCCEKKESAKACTGCEQTAETWMTPPAQCKKSCKAAM